MTDNTINQFLQSDEYGGPPDDNVVFSSGGGATIVYGCTDPSAYNYNPSATADNGVCQYTITPPIVPIGGQSQNIIVGCTNPNAANYNPSANTDDGSCIVITVLPRITKIVGCGDTAAKNYNPAANIFDNSLCEYDTTSRRLGCTVPSARNYDPLAIADDGSCVFNPPPLPPDDNRIQGCTQPGNQNYNPAATVDDGSCIPHRLGCTFPNAKNYNSRATLDDGSCIFESPVYGCINENAINYNRLATIDDGSCIFQPPLTTGCKNPSAKNYDPNAFYHDGSMCQYDAINLPPQEPPLFASLDLNAAVKVVDTTSIKIEYSVTDPVPAGNITIEVEPIELNISSVILGLINAYVRDAYDTFIDPDRFYKLLLNYGEDKQNLIANYRLNPIDSTQLQLKLTKAVPEEIFTNTSVFLGREVAKTFIDDIRIAFPPTKDKTPYLRPLNNKIQVPGNYKQTVQANLEVLNLTTGSAGTLSGGVVTFEDSIFRKWYSYDWKSAELNQNFTDYSNFVFYGSAELRLAAFKEKLRKIELAQLSSIQSAVYITTASSATGSLSTLAGPITFATSSNEVTVISGSIANIPLLSSASTEYAIEIENIIRTFDPYERYLFYGNNSIAYSASADYVEGFVEYNSSGAWPKNSAGQLFSISTTSASVWYTQQSQIANRFDEQNQNSLVYLIPSHISFDGESESFMTFILAVGHYFDNIKPYIDQMPTNIYDRGFNPEEGMSIDLVWEVAENFGIKLPNPYSVYSIQQYILPSSDQDTIRVSSAETWKRFLNSLVYLLKSRGSKTALQSFLRILGIHPQLISVKESELNTTSSFFITEEFSNALEFDGAFNSYIKVPLSASLRDIKTVQLRFATAIAQDVTLANFDNSVAVNIATLPADNRFGRIEVISGSILMLSSSYHKIFDTNFMDVMIRRHPTYVDLTVIENDGEDLIYSSSNVAINSQLVSTIVSSSDLYIGGSGSIKSITNFDGVIDEVRAWGELIEDDSFIAQTYDPGSYTGNTYTSSIQNLFVQLSFNREFDLSTRFLANETPYFNLNGVSDQFDFIARTNIELIEVEGFVSNSAYTRLSRKVRINTPTIGGSAYTSTKVKVAQPPVFTPMDLDSDGVPTLKRNTSIVKLNEKNFKKGTNLVSLTISPTDFQNQNIARAFGGFNINNLIGDPAELAAPEYKKLKELQTIYSQYFYSNVDANRLIRIFETVLDEMAEFVDFLVPIKAKLQSGILIEPNILERVKIQEYRQISVDGTETRRSLEAANTASLYPSTDYIYSLEQTINVEDASFIPTGGMNEKTSYDDYLLHIPVEVGPRDIPKNPSSSAEDSYKTYESLVELDDTAFISSPTNFAELFVSGIVLETVDNTLHISTQYNSPSKLTEQEGYFLETLFTDGATITESNILTFVSKSKNEDSLAENAFITYTSGSTILLNDDVFLGGKNSSENYNSIGQRTELDSFPTYKAIFDSDIYNVRKFGVVFDNNRIKFVTDGSGEVYPFAIGISLRNDANGNPIDRNNIRYLYDIGPSTDFSDLGVTNYFYKEDGLYRFPEKIYSAIGKNTLNFLSGTYTDTRILSGAFAEWEYGNTYFENDVVVQNISSVNDVSNPQNSTLKTVKVHLLEQIQVVSQLRNSLSIAETESNRLNILDELRTEETKLTKITEQYNKIRDNLRTAAAGNKYFYKFTRKTSAAGFNSYIPPAIDRENWELILYLPTLRQTPKRVILDTDQLDIFSKVLSNITVVNSSISADVFGRNEFVLRNEVNIAPTQTITGVLNIAKIAELLAIKFDSSTNYRITLYRTAAQRTEDIDSNRPFGAEPLGDHGVLFDAQVTNNTYNILNPTVRLANGDASEETAIYYRITNLDAVSKVFRLRLYLYVYEGEKKVPLGYLPRHYKFSRDNATATKRRNYIGCVQTQDTTTDGLSPIEVTLSSGTDITVSAVNPNESIILGGGGTLNVT
jgi:hypothetical protein